MSCDDFNVINDVCVQNKIVSVKKIISSQNEVVDLRLKEKVD